VSTALVTGGASGIGAALVARLRAEGFEVQVLDLTTGFDVGAPHDWDTVDPSNNDSGSNTWIWVLVAGVALAAIAAAVFFGRRRA